MKGKLIPFPAPYLDWGSLPWSFTSQLKAAEEKLSDLDALQKASSEGKLEIENLRQQLEAAEKQIKNLEIEKDAESSKVCSNILCLFFFPPFLILRCTLFFS